MKQTFYSNGKLLLTGEYAVLDGAKGLALPTKFGQDLTVEQTDGSAIYWKSYDCDGSIWCEETFSLEEIINRKRDENETRNTLIKILNEAYLLNQEVFQKGYSVETRLTFPKFWGLGTSSTLINNIAQWLKVDAYTLLQNSFGGSGYDIACARHNSPLVYRLQDGKPVVKEVAFEPAFKECLYFVYLNKKQSSKIAIASYNKNTSSKAAMIAEINSITEEILTAQNLHSFCELLEKHETILSNFMGLEKVKTVLFSDFSGTIKSLGAWGGDFILAVAEENPHAYFRKKGYETIVLYSEMVLK